MISSLFIGSPWSSVGHVCGPAPSRLGHDRGLSEDRSPGTAQKGNGACENWALLIPRLKSVRESGRGIARPFAIYSNCKSTVSSVHGVRVEFFFRQEARQLFQADADAECRKFRRTSVQRDLLRAAPI